MTNSGQNCSSGQLRGWSFRSRHTCPLPRSNQWQYTRSNPDDNNKKNCSFSSNYEHTHHPSSGPLKRQGKELDRRLPLGCCNNCEQQHLQGDHAHLLHPSIFVFHNVRIPYFCDELHLHEHSARRWIFHMFCGGLFIIHAFGGLNFSPFCKIYNHLCSEPVSDLWRWRS